MHGLSLNFELKRQRRINKIMNYVILLAFAIAASALAVYAPYLSKLNELNDAKTTLVAARNKYEKLIGEEFVIVGSSAEEISYSEDYIILRDSKYDYRVISERIEEVFGMAEYSSITLRKITINGTDKKITINYSNHDGIDLETGEALKTQLENDFIHPTEIFEEDGTAVETWKPKTVSSRSTSTGDFKEMEMTLIYG